jgi:hypothetical protein
LKRIQSQRYSMRWNLAAIYSKSWKRQRPAQVVRAQPRVIRLSAWVVSILISALNLLSWQMKEMSSLS